MRRTAASGRSPRYPPKGMIISCADREIASPRGGRRAASFSFRRGDASARREPIYHMECRLAAGPMILMPIPHEKLAGALDRFTARLSDGLWRVVLARIRATSPDRASGDEAEAHRLAALSFARGFGMAIHPEGTPGRFNWDGTALNGATEAYVILHEVAHFALAPPERRSLIEFGLGPGPDTLDRDAAERAAVLSALAREEDEAAASLLGIVWEASLEQPALASFLDQNWLEGLDRSAAAHFTAVVETLRQRGFVSVGPAPALSTAPTGGRGPHCWSRWPWPPPRY